MSDEFDPDPFTEALRQDLPSAEDEARVRARLATAGVLAGVGAVAPGATAATGTAVAGSATAGVVAKVLALPLAVKLGATAALVGAVAVPLGISRHRESSREGSRVPAVSAPAASPVAKVPHADVTSPNADVTSPNPMTSPHADATSPNPTTSPHADVTSPNADVTSPNADVTSPHADATSPNPTTSPNADVTSPHADVTSPNPMTSPNADVTSPSGAGRSSRPKSREGAAVMPSSAARPALPAVGAFPIAPAVEDEGTLRAETALMEQALGAIKHGDWVTAKQKLAEHARTFPNGHLAPERERALERMREKETSQ